MGTIGVPVGREEPFFPKYPEVFGFGQTILNIHQFHDFVFVAQAKLVALDCCQVFDPEGHRIVLTGLQLLVFQLQPQGIIAGAYLWFLQTQVSRTIDIPNFYRDEVGTELLPNQVIDAETFGEGLQPGVAGVRKAVIGIYKTPTAVVFEGWIEIQNQFLNRNHVQSGDGFRCIGISGNQFIRRDQGRHVQNVLANQDQIEGRNSIDVIAIQAGCKGIILSFHQIIECKIACCTRLGRIGSLSTQGNFHIGQTLIHFGFYQSPQGTLRNGNTDVSVVLDIDKIEAKIEVRPTQTTVGLNGQRVVGAIPSIHLHKDRAFIGTSKDQTVLIDVG